MSEIRDRVDALIESERTPGLFIHSIYDDLPLTVDGFRLLCHLSRRSDNDSHIAQTTYEKMGEVCFRATYPRSTAAALRKRAMAAMKELVGFGLVRVEATTGWDGGQGANKYILTHCSAWRPEYQPGPGTTARLARVSPETPPQSAGADPPPVHPGGPPQSAGADPPSPLERTHKVILIEGNPYKRIDHDRVQSEKTKSEDLEPVSHVSLSSQPDQTATPPTSKTKRASSRQSRKESARTRKEPKYHPEAFKQFWESYRKFCRDVEASVGLNQTRWEAIESWDNLLEAGEALEAIVDGTEWYMQCKREEYRRKGEAFGVSHAFRYLRDRKWEAALEHKRGQQESSEAASVSAMASAQDRLRVKDRIIDFIKILGMTAVLPAEWQQQTGKLLVKDLTAEESVEFLAMLEERYQATTRAS